ncbi:hypothetical protein MNB_SUP05-SYMBIONT-7-710 [hydrothermal vent metagenome]|uniref:Uncharacterized protein n=1 Tax=hydrothermal vent metagenome TaxID=652676 RepID=A0A1W1E3H4_9ZZZZ
MEEYPDANACTDAHCVKTDFVQIGLGFLSIGKAEIFGFFPVVYKK